MTKKITIKQRVRDYLSTVKNPATLKPSQIASQLKIPQSSARRIVQELFREGFEYSPEVKVKKPERYPQIDFTVERKVDPNKSPIKPEKLETIDSKDFTQAQFAVMQEHMKTIMEVCEGSSQRLVSNADGTIDGEIIFTCNVEKAAQIVEKWYREIPYLPMFVFGEWVIRRFPSKQNVQEGQFDTGSDTIISPNGRRLKHKVEGYRWQTATSYMTDMNTIRKVTLGILEKGEDKGYGPVYAICYRVHWNLGQSRPIRER